MRVQLTAFYEVHDCHDGQRQNGGDGTSSGGTTSPDAYHKPTRNGFDAALLKAELKEVVLLTPEHLARGSCLKSTLNLKTHLQKIRLAMQAVSARGIAGRGVPGVRTPPPSRARGDQWDSSKSGKKCASRVGGCVSASWKWCLCHGVIACTLRIIIHSLRHKTAHKTYKTYKIARPRQKSST